MLRYRLEFVCPGELPLPDHVYRDAPIREGTVELYGATRYVVASDEDNVRIPRRGWQAAGEVATLATRSRPLLR
jgi:hypothetical protein